MSEIINFYKNLQKKLAWLQFDSSCRVEIYRSLSLFLKNHVQLNIALQNILEIYGGSDPYSQHPIVHAIREILSNMENGLNFSDSVSNWIPQDEKLMLSAGEQSGILNETFDSVVELIEEKSRITGSIIGALAYPFLLLLLTSGLLYMVSTTLVDKLQQMVPIEQWHGSARWLYYISNFTRNYGALTLISIISFCLSIYFSIGILTGKIRVYLDKIPPWSLYRMIQGSTFLLNLSAILKSGQQINNAISDMKQFSSPWLKERLDAINIQLSKGKSFGKALCDTKFDFPDANANRFLSVISEYSGLEGAMRDIGKKWMDNSVKEISKLSNMCSTIGLVSVGGIMLLVVAGASGLQNSLQQNYSI